MQTVKDVNSNLQVSIQEHMKILLATNDFFDNILPTKEIENLLITPENSVLFKTTVTGSLNGSAEVLNKQDQKSKILIFR